MKKFEEKLQRSSNNNSISMIILNIQFWTEHSNIQSLCYSTIPIISENSQKCVINLIEKQ